jgi:glycosylphosphatidylinositol transamidase (GPIT) subunit GPI8
MPNLTSLRRKWCAGENSYSHDTDQTIGVSLVDRFTYFTQRVFEGVQLSSNKTLQDWYNVLTYTNIHSNIETKCALRLISPNLSATL